MADVEWKGYDSLKAKLTKLPKVAHDAIWDGNFDIVEKVQGYAVQELQSSVKHGNGELAGSLKYEVVDRDGKCVGRVWSDDPVALYRELGTGRVGEMSPKDLPDGMEPTYRQTPWFIPADAVDIDLNEIYGMPKIKINGKVFYRTNGQPARQFLTPAINNVKDEAPKIMKDKVKAAIKSELGD
ncbi:hypothetical protein C5Z25_01550 [Lactobacillus sp. CBA3605]|uniref:hypothetical protein n=1 Tax=Lactobacillus sp. CBA3605 TaxID=2099788 RepID=UPI000CFCD74D|nr:hypothetical protein [Lactobacillus sp. CBA3605]AVK60532.1 hypothetical protein C5Z25_01550 [Lactobacillus sp. CBA3605]